jgi:poly(A) polymerase Pap1
MPLFSSSVEREALDHLKRLASSVERIANHFDLQRAGASAFIGLDGDYKEDGSKVSYVDPVHQFVEEQKRLEYFDKTGILIRDDQPIPGAVQEDGKGWIR